MTLTVVREGQLLRVRPSVWRGDDHSYPDEIPLPSFVIEAPPLGAPASATLYRIGLAMAARYEPQVDVPATQ